MVTSEWALPTCSRTTWRRCQLVFELRPAYDPKAYGFNCVLSLGICRHRSGSGTGTAIPGVGEGDHHSSRAWYALSKQIYALLSQSSPNSTTSPNRKLDQALRRDGLWDRSFGRHAESTAIILRKASVDGVILHKPCVGRLQDVIANLKGMETLSEVKLRILVDISRTSRSNTTSSIGRRSEETSALLTIAWMPDTSPLPLSLRRTREGCRSRPYRGQVWIRARLCPGEDLRDLQPSTRLTPGRQRQMIAATLS
jgi:hypothetical protein